MTWTSSWSQRCNGGCRAQKWRPARPAPFSLANRSERLSFRPTAIALRNIKQYMHISRTDCFYSLEVGARHLTQSSRDTRTAFLRPTAIAFRNRWQRLMQWQSPALLKQRSSRRGNLDDRMSIRAYPRDESAFVRLLPDREPRTRSAPGFHHLGISPLLAGDVLQEIEDQGIHGVGHGWIRLVNGRILTLA
jgi:hypothetical protein